MTAVLTAPTAHRPTAATAAASSTGDDLVPVEAAPPTGPRRAVGDRPGGPAGPAPVGPAGAGPGRTGRGAGRAGRRARAPLAVSDLATSFARLFCEVEAGQRPRRHLEAVMSASLVARIAPVWVRPGPPARVVSATGAFVTESRYAAVAVLRRGARCSALALELERRGRVWLVVEAARPEDGVLPQPDPPPPFGERDSFDLLDVR